MYFLIVLVLIGAAYLEFRLVDNAYFKILNFITVGIAFFILIGFNSYSPDLENYTIHYANLDEDVIRLSVEPVIFNLMRFCAYLGLSFQGYQAILGVLIGGFFFAAIYKYSPLPAFVLLNFYFIPFFPDIAQVRFFLGFSIFLYALQFYSSKKWLFYTLFLVAFLCHYSLIIFVFYFIIRKFNFFASQLKSNLLIILGVVVLTIVPKSILEPIVILLNPKYLLYLEDGTGGTFLGTLILFLPFFMVNNIIIYHYNHFFKAEINERGKNPTLELFVSLIHFSNFLILFQYFIRDFSRITQNLYILAIIYFSIVIFHQKIFSFSKYTAAFMLCLVFFGTIIIYYCQFLMVNNFEYFKVIQQTYTSNRVLSFFYEFFN